MSTFKNKVVVITGGNSWIRPATPKELIPVSHSWSAAVVTIWPSSRRRPSGLALTT